MSRRVALLAVAAAAVLLLLWFVLLWRPQSGSLEAADERLAAAEAEHGALQLRLARLEAAQEQTADLMADVEGMRRAVPDDAELAQFILDANDIAVTAGVTFLSITPSVPAASLEAGLVSEVSLAIAVRGTYDAVVDYLDLLEELPRIVVVDTVSVNPDLGDALAVSLTARMFTTAPPVAPAGSVDAGATTTTATPTTETTGG